MKYENYIFDLYAVSYTHLDVYKRQADGDRDWGRYVIWNTADTDRGALYLWSVYEEQEYGGGRDLKKQLTNPASPRMIKTAKNKGCEKEEYT